MTATMKSILFVDDDELLLSCLKKRFARVGGFEPATAVNGSVALELLKGRAFDYIVSDINMPVMDGIEFFKSLHSQGNTTPFLFMSGHMSSDDVAVRLGADYSAAKFESIQKPAGCDEIIKVLDRIAA